MGTRVVILDNGSGEETAREINGALRAAPHGQAATLGRCACWCPLFDVRVEDLTRRDGYFLDGSMVIAWDEWDVSLRAVSPGYPVVAALRASHHSTQSAGSGPLAAPQDYQASSMLFAAVPVVRSTSQTNGARAANP